MFVEWPEAGVGALPPARAAVSHRARRRRSPPHRARSRRDGAARRHRVMLVLAFDTATDVATSALLETARSWASGSGRRARCSRTSTRSFAEAGATPARPRRARRRDGPGKLHEHADRPRGRARARARARCPGRRCLDARRARSGADRSATRSSTRAGGEVFVPAPRASRPTTSSSSRGRCASAAAPFATARRSSAWAPSCLRTTTTLHVPHARLHAALAREFGPVDAIQPIYVRAPDAEGPELA